MVPVMLTFYDSDLKTVKERSRSKFRGWVVSDLVGGSFRSFRQFSEGVISSLVVLAKV